MFINNLLLVNFSMYVIVYLPSFIQNESNKHMKHVGYLQTNF